MKKYHFCAIISIMSPNHEKSSREFIKSVRDQIEDIGEQDVVPPIFRLGKAATKEIIVDDVRALSWDLMGNEEVASKIANWEQFAVDIDKEKGVGTLFIPKSTRNAKSVLSGKEAWEGEKRTIVNAVANYINVVEEGQGGYDVNLGWNSVGVTPEQKIFIAPPNPIMKIEEAEKQTLKQEMVVVLGRLLENDEANLVLADEFSRAIRRVPHDRP